MQLSTKGLALLKNSEGFRSQSYLDVAGIRTIAYGHRILPTESFPNGIDEAQGAELLTGDVRVAENAVKRLVKVELVQCQFDALVDFVYNLGPRRLEASTLLRMLNIGRYGAAADELLRWDHAGAHENAGLKARREAEFMLWHSADSGQLPVA
ncbi:MAG: lysozyme [Terracidiphilus sp.]|jgi:lysozyme